MVKLHTILAPSIRVARATFRPPGRSCLRTRSTITSWAMRKLQLVPTSVMRINTTASLFENPTPTRSYSASAIPFVAIGDKVSIQLSGKVSNGDPFGQADPITFIVGSGDVISGINDAVVGLTKGDTKHVEIAPEDAFGKQKHIYTVPRQQMRLSPEDDKALAVGQVLTLQNGEHARVIKVSEESIDIDLSHPYAGESLILDITVVDAIARSDLKPEEQLVIPEELVAGDNATFPQRGDTLKMHYTGSLASDNTVFDSSVTRGTPFEFQIGVGQVIRGWDEGVMLMSKGQKAVLRIPSAKGYGKAGAGGVIPPNADLVFEVELLDIISRQG